MKIGFFGFLLLAAHTALGSSFKIHTATGESGAGRIYALGSFNLTSDYCLLDTGARISVADLSFLYGDYPIVGKETSIGIGGKPIAAELILVGKILVGDFIFTNHVIRRQYPAPSSCVLGNELLRDKTYRLDFDSKTVSTVPPLVDGEPLTSLAGLWDGMTVGIDGKDFVALFDTGAARTVVDLELVKASPTAFVYEKEIEVEDATGEKIEVSVYNLKRLLIGSHQLENLSVFATDLSTLRKQADNSMILLGYNAIAPFNWVLDHSSKRWTATPRVSVPQP